ncbi:MAG TPA: DUF6671 family protein [Puia sp.]|uniref:DUF6671 family protein n=1 Tax=Puia sp. TaxID=2045100 RepID=UPI002BEB14CF|nr:DUF6671 family protein [Puia sp.]HVU97080.1 DUF6671 family protein [Puia sp.]
MFTGRKLLIATQHGKERVMAPLLAEALGVVCSPTIGLDTDQLGTFTGEIERKDDPVTAARKKCMLAMDLCGGDLAVASEGSFGMHPVVFFSYADEEIVLMRDRLNDLEIVARETSTDTNFGGAVVCNDEQLLDFAGRHLFPSHALILRASKDDRETIVKGITDVDTLMRHFRQLCAVNDSAFVETDMRAMYNPTRLSFIEKVTKKLIEKVRSLCPRCSCPGFGSTQAIPGLACERCGWPTRSIQSYIYDCRRCGYREQREVSGREQPQYCDNCNP